MDNITTENKNTFFNHVFSTTEDSKAEILNVIQYAILAIIPIVILNKTIQKFIPEADNDKSNLELTIEILIQLIIIFIGIILIHRIITYIPTYSGFKYENLTLTNVIIAFLIIVLSIQTKLGIKVNILVDRVNELWNGPSSTETQDKKVLKVKQQRHSPSQADYMDSEQPTGIFPPAPIATSSKPQSQPQQQLMEQTISMEPMAANSVLGGSFGSSF